MLIYNKIPYTIRRDDYSYHSCEDIEQFLLDAFPESFIGKHDIASVYVDNKYSPQNIIVETYKGIKSLEKTVTINWKNYKDQYGEPLNIWVTYIESNILPDINIIKSTCSKLNLNQNELAYLIGVKEQSLRNMISKNKFTTQVHRSIDLLIENNKLKQQLEDYYSFKQSLQKFIQPTPQTNKSNQETKQ